MALQHFGYFPEENVRVVERDRQVERFADGWSPDRRELREVLHRLRIRYGRRRLFRTADVAAVVQEVRGELRTLRFDTPPRMVATPRRGTPPTRK